MASTTAMFTALTGLNANARSLDVIGNNIANVNTTAFKSSRMLFSTQFNLTNNVGTPPGDVNGGTNPYQIGLGVTTAGTQRNFNPGTIQPTGQPRDLAIDGDGFFVVQQGNSTGYTRNGAFQRTALGDLVTVSGARLMGYGVDEQFNINRGSLAPINIPLGSLTIAEATTQLTFRGNLNSAGAVAVQGSRVSLGGAPAQGLVAIATAAPPPAVGNVLEDATRLVDIEDPLLVGTGTPLFSVGQSLQMRGAEKGGKTIPTVEFAITDTTTVAELRTFLGESLGINTTLGANPDGLTPGVGLDATTGLFDIIGNIGTSNDVQLDSTDLRLLDATGQFVRHPLSTEKVADADGESVRTTFVVYDSLGSAVEVDIAAVLDSRDSTGTTWRYFVDSTDDAGTNLAITTGQLTFDTDGRLSTTTVPPVSIDRSGTGAASPLVFTLGFGGGAENVTSLADDTSELAATFRDGSPIGTLSGFAVGSDGTVIGAFSNGLTRALGQVAVATFANAEGLVELGDSTFGPGANSGSAVITQPGVLGAGLIVGGALELANVDIGEEFIKMISASTGYSASSRVIRTTDELMQQLLVLGR
jgi:flagellar hook protein FlgE